MVSPSISSKALISQSWPRGSENSQTEIQCPSSQYSKTYTVFLINEVPVNLQRFRQYFEGRKFLVYYLQTYREAHAVMAGVFPDIIIGRIDAQNDEGRSFFETVQYHSPRTVRIAVSDEQNRRILMQLLVSGIVQRFLCYPWQKNNLEEILNRDLVTRSRIRTSRCWKYLQRGHFLPSVPSIVREIEQILAEPEFTLKEIVKVIEQDPLVATRLLQIVNSAAFAKSGTINDLLLAVSYMGINCLRELLLFICAIESFSLEKKCDKIARRIARHSFMCGKLARMIASTYQPGEVREASTAALLHDIGKLVMLTNSGDKLTKLIAKSGDYGHLWPTGKIEEEIFGFRYPEIGSCLLLLWNLPMNLIESVAGIEYPLLDLQGVSRIVAIADRCLMETARNDSVDLDLETLIPHMPVDKWRKAAQLFIHAGRNAF
jgi:HD-like signal output (HDOD) protein